MASNPNIRASDADRDRIATALREDLAEGRLTTEEFDERLDKALAAKTLGELDGLMADLPSADVSQRADTALDRAEDDVPSRRASFYPARRTAWGVLFTLGVLILAIWLISGAHPSLSVLWVFAALAVLIIARWISGGRARSERRSAQPRPHHRRPDGGKAWQ